MSIIHDALKKAQQTLNPQPEEKPVNPSGTSSKGSSYIYAETSPVVETLPPVKNKIKSIFINTCVVLITLAITIACVEYILKQFKTNIPQVQKFAKKSIYRLVHKKELPDFKLKTPEELKPLAQLTVNSTPASAPTTLNIHGIMSDGKGNVVLINDQVYQEGDEVDGTRIVKINLDSITVDTNGTEKTIYVKS